MKKILVTALKFSISFTILGYLFYQAAQDEHFQSLLDQSKDWGLLGGALVAALGAVSLTFYRWYLLVRALDLPFTLRDGFRLGFLGYFFNFLSLGVVGGDALKAVFIARELPRRRTEVVATVIIDRILGLYALFLVSSVAFLTVDWESLNVRDADQLASLRWLSACAVTVVIVGAAGIGLVLLPGFATSSLWDTLSEIPKVGGAIDRLIGAVRVYRRRKRLLAATIVLSLGVHSLNALAVYLVACGLPGNHPALGTHFMVVPIAMLAGAVPLPGGMGAFEFALDVLYHAVSSADVAPRQGFVVALAFRVITLMIALVGMFFYLTHRREVARLMKEAERLREDASADDVGPAACAAIHTSTTRKRVC